MTGRESRAGLVPERAQVEDWAVIRVALIDDDPSIRLLVRLAAESCEDLEVVGEAEDGLSGLAMVRETRPDVLVLDMEMPGMRGDGVARCIDDEHLPCKVVLHTGHDLQPGLRGVRSCVSKTGDMDALLAAVRAAAAA